MLPRQTRETADRGLPLKTTQNKSKQKNPTFKGNLSKITEGKSFLVTIKAIFSPYFRHGCEHTASPVLSGGNTAVSSPHRISSKAMETALPFIETQG